jgi:hypothetical protein
VLARTGGLGEWMHGRYPVFIGLVLASAITLPFALRQNAWYEWSNPYWLLLLQRDEILVSGRPSYFIHRSPTGVFYPVNLFYAGFTVSILAYVSLVIPPWLVFCGAIAASAYAAFIGVRWATRALGVGVPISTALAALYVTNPQYVGKLYTRGAWAEFIAISMVTLLIGSCLRAVTDAQGGRSTRGVLVLAAISAALVAGTHNLTLAIGLPVVALLTSAHAWSVHRNRHDAIKASVGPCLAIAQGIGATGVFTLPNLWLSSSTAITSWDYLDRVPEWNTPAAVLRPHLTGSMGRVNEAPSLLLLPIAVLLVALLLGRRDRISRELHDRRANTTTAVAAVAMVAVLLTLTTRGSLWSDRSSVLHRITPEKFLLTIQFPSRLTAFTAIALVILVACLLGSTLDSRGRTVARATIVATAIWYVGTALFLVATIDPSQSAGVEATTRASISADRVPPAFAPDQQTQFLLTERGLPVDRPDSLARFEPDGHVDPGTDLVPGGRYATNVVWSPLVRISGGRLLGRDAGGHAVIEIGDTQQVRALSARPLPVWLGAALSATALLSALFWLAWSRTHQQPATNRETDLATA